MTLFKPRVGKVIFAQTTGGLSVIIPKKKKTPPSVITETPRPLVVENPTNETLTLKISNVNPQCHQARNPLNIATTPTEL